MTPDAANTEMQAHFGDCQACTTGAGSPDDLCAEGLRLYCQYLAALAAEKGFDPMEFPTFKRYAGTL